MTKQVSKAPAMTPPTSNKPKPLQQRSDLLALRAQLARAEKVARRASKSVGSKKKAMPVKKQRAAELDGITTDDFSLTQAHHRLREAVYNADYHVCAHAIQHARAEGFLEHDIMEVLLAGRVRAVYPNESRWLICGYFEAHGICLPLHVVAEHYRDGYIDIVTAFVPKHPHHIISRARLAIMLRYDEEAIQTRIAQPGNRSGYRSKGKWRKSA